MEIGGTQNGASVCPQMTSSSGVISHQSPITPFCGKRLINIFSRGQNRWILKIFNEEISVSPRYERSAAQQWVYWPAWFSSELLSGGSLKYIHVNTWLQLENLLTYFFACLWMDYFLFLPLLFCELQLATTCCFCLFCGVLLFLFSVTGKRNLHKVYNLMEKRNFLQWVVAETYCQGNSANRPIWAYQIASNTFTDCL